MTEEFYNVWFLDENRWTNYDDQDVNNPKPLSYEKAKKLASQLNGSSAQFEVRLLATKQVSVSKTDTLVAVNDHTCKWCNNNRCSKTEKSCWKCGGKLS